jgi:hypothetical protein
MSAITIPTRYSNIFDGTREEYSRLARKFLTNKDNFQNGKQSLKNFTKIYGYLKEGNVIKGAVLSQGNITFPDKLKQNISRQKSEKKRESNLKGLTPEIRKQIDFLNETTAVEEEYEADRNNPDAGKIRDRKMKALWKKYRRQEKYDSTKTYKWKEGKSEKGYFAWQNNVFNDLKGGEDVDIDHGKSGARGGTNSRTNLSLQDSTWNRWIKANNVEFQRTDEQYDEAGIAFDKDRSFQEYLAFEDDPNIKLVTDLGLEGMTDIHKRVGVDVNAVIAQNEQRLQKQAYDEVIASANQPYTSSLLKDQVRESNIFKDSSNVFDKENGFITHANGAAKYLVEESVNATVESYTGIPNVTSLFKGSKKLIEGDARGLLDIAPNLRQTTTTPYGGLQASIR